MLTVVRVRAYENGLVFRHGDLIQLLEPGVYRLWTGWGRGNTVVQLVYTLETRFQHARLDLLIRNPIMREALTIVDLADQQRALVWKDNRLGYILGPGRYAFWNKPFKLQVEVFDTNQIRFEHDKIEAVLAFPEASQWLQTLDVSEHESVLLFKDGKFEEELGIGRHVFWAQGQRLRWQTIDRREQMIDVAGQEIMTRDTVTLRVNLLVTYQVVDARKVTTTVSDHATTLYREAQLALRAAVGTRSLDALLADKDLVSREVGQALSSRAAEFGVHVKSVGLKDIILPGEMRTILNRVVEAEKAAQANLIKRREETAAARSQANTAKLLAENPILARMKELELVQEILAGARLSLRIGEGDFVGRLKRLFGGTAPSGE